MGKQLKHLRGFVLDMLLTQKPLFHFAVFTELNCITQPSIFEACARFDFDQHHVGKIVVAPSDAAVAPRLSLLLGASGHISECCKAERAKK